MLDNEKLIKVNNIIDLLHDLTEEVRRIDSSYTERFQAVRTRQNLKSAIEHLEVASKRLMSIK